ncbi:MAG: DNA repair protein RadC [Bacteroidales bacterium]|nr:DNA repair protein RadC [Bacteroidales bacterium]
MKKQERIPISEWAIEDRPREKLLLKGITALSDAELLAILIGSGNDKESAVELAQRILYDAHNNINTLGKLSVKELIAGYKGIGEAKAITIAAALELGKRRKHEIVRNARITCSKDVFDFFHPILSDLPYEEFWLLLLNRNNRIIEHVRIGQGGVSETAVDIKIILKTAVMKLASGIVLCHNHPSGNNTPSKADCLITEKIKIAASFMDIVLQDHLIVCDDCFYSFADKNHL